MDPKMNSSSALSSVGDDGGMTSAAAEPEGPRSERPLRRSFTPTEKVAHLAAYETACQNNQGGAYLRSEGLFSSQITEWRKLRDAGLLTGKKAGDRVGKPSAEQAEIARLRRDLDRAERRLATTETALTIMGKAHALLEQISESADTDDRRGKR
jgi:transposase